MIEKVKDLIHDDARCKTIIKKVYEHPYIELKEVYKDVSKENRSFYEKALQKLMDEYILVELTSQAGSSVESRVPKKILIINPEISAELEEIL
ncbi:hypothetical protein JOC94_001804 [Bacillus thermophilus]|uniref:Uncharacterized protein n=1 Tax=Siminovitchia thermophila TaxID=1245522 RepID=A0ABS2R5B1_9BACI|nr:hypothetical protein [Siminovitchia thermophila]MBM7714832.1 hypothetical protein [Siminovitchia thermophila]ONK21718.1 hypothetical protein BLX87_19690 [Bacillus sp. VT-16-64]